MSFDKICKHVCPAFISGIELTKILPVKLCSCLRIISAKVLDFSFFLVSEYFSLYSVPRYYEMPSK